MPLLLNKTMDKLKYDLVREGLIELDVLNVAEENAQKNSNNLSDELILENLITEKNLLDFVQKRLHIPYVELADYNPDIDCLRFISIDDAKKYNIFPLFMIEDVLTIAMSDPLDLFAINTLFNEENISIEPVVCSEQSIKKAINDYYRAEKTEFSWQDKLITFDLNDGILSQIISEIISDAIKKEVSDIYMERSVSGLNIFFNRELVGYIPNIIVTRFLFELFNNAGIDSVQENIPQKSRFNFSFNGENYPVIISVFPAKSGSRIALSINKPRKNISENLKNKLSVIMKKPAFILVENAENEFKYSLAEYLSEKFFVLMAEDTVRYELSSVTQIETNKNTGVYFDEIINHIELQNFDIIFWEKVYTKEQFEKLKLLSKEKTIFVSFAAEDFGDFDFVLSQNGKIA